MHLFTGILLIMYAASQVRSEPTPDDGMPASPEVPNPNHPGTKDILYTRMDGKVVPKYVAVPNEYSLDTVKHADMLGAVGYFDNGEKWLTLDGKLLFRYSDDATIDPLTGDKPEGEEPIQNWRVMGPRELAYVLSVSEPFEELYAMFMEYERTRSR